MKFSFFKKVFPFLLTLPAMLQPALAWENRYDGGWGNQNYYQPLESIEYNGVIIVHQQVPPRTDVCPWVVNRGFPCEGWIWFNESTRTHIFHNYSHQQNNQWGNQQWNHQWQNPGWNNRVCLYQNKHVRILCN